MGENRISLNRHNSYNKLEDGIEVKFNPFEVIGQKAYKGA